ncbi:CheR family methyltransferase [Minwuia thermotolerans]|uniref:histidine kinase n=1 Tax=Minwuia thermotolerans TaxID=2056226 RepID=A0A2M9G6S5_9PROT|nr:CheR family methyltransferase [Minwuia thermotolerans]PJK31376.1 hypothetical protein CVT23_01460 [Minwuia thermotolerans]
MNEKTGDSFAVVALGGSAGALAAYQAFFRALDEKIGEDGTADIAFLVIPHLSPDHESMMAEILQSATRLPVRSITGETAIRAGHVHVLLPGQTLDVRDGRLLPKDRAAGAAHHPVDDIFTALAQDVGARTIAAVLSGTGANGSAGLAAVREHNGLVLAQTPESAEFPEMPQNAIQTGLVDAIRAPAEMAGLIVRYAANGHGGRDDIALRDHDAAGDNSDDLSSDGQRRLGAVINAIRSETGLDFTPYKNGTLQRRIERRLQLSGGAFEDYVARLDGDPEEVRALANDLLISVTGFFRDPPAWDMLLERAIRPIVQSEQGDVVRAWVAGCASGEEAYTLAILLREEMEAQRRHGRVEVFATDISEAAVARARQGVYPAAAVQALSEKRQHRYFQREGDTVRVRPELRESVVFAAQNLLQDPPFARMDLVVCRNVLIYLRPEFQRRLIRLFHFSLRPGGYLFLGNVESISGETGLFEAIDTDSRLYARTEPAHASAVPFPVAGDQGGGSSATPAARTRPGAAPRATELTLKALADRHAPPSVLIDQDYEVLYFHGGVERYLKPQAGEPSRNLLLLLRDGMSTRLRSAVEQARASGAVHVEPAQASTPAGTMPIHIEVAPLTARGAENRWLVSFVERPEARAATGAETARSDTRERELEEEIRLLQRELDACSAEAGRAQEDLKSYNEEIMSMNEELRATNEELETSKEELQSLNEELNAVNNQLRSKVEALRERTSDLDNLLNSTDVQTLFLDTGLAVRWFSPGMEALFVVRSSDQGRVITELVQHFDDPGFEADCRAVLRDLTRREREIPGPDGRWYQRRISPYRTGDDRIDGVVASFSDITEVQAARQYAESIVETMPGPLLVLDSDLRVQSANAAFYETFQVAPEQTAGRLIYDLGNGQWNIPELRQLLSETLSRESRFENHLVEHRFESIGQRIMLLNGRRLDSVDLILLGVVDVTEQQRAETHQRLLMEELDHRLRNWMGVVQGLALQTKARSDTLQDFWEEFEGRLAALARGHELLLDRSTTPAGMMDVVRQAAAETDAARLHPKGPNVDIAPKKAVSLMMVLHEFIASAARDGALHEDGHGHVELHWILEDDDVIRVTWQEVGGPTSALERSRAFDDGLIAQLVEYDLGGSLHVGRGSDGLLCEFTLQRA